MIRSSGRIFSKCKLCQTREYDKRLKPDTQEEIEGRYKEYFVSYEAYGIGYKEIAKIINKYVFTSS